jgi:hypothetical protein
MWGSTKDVNYRRWSCYIIFRRGVALSISAIENGNHMAFDQVGVRMSGCSSQGRKTCYS